MKLKMKVNQKSLRAKSNWNRKEKSESYRPNSSLHCRINFYVCQLSTLLPALSERQLFMYINQ